MPPRTIPAIDSALSCVTAPTVPSTRPEADATSRAVPTLTPATAEPTAAAAEPIAAPTSAITAAPMATMGMSSHLSDTVGHVFIVRSRHQKTVALVESLLPDIVLRRACGRVTVRSNNWTQELADHRPADDI